MNTEQLPDLYNDCRMTLQETSRDDVSNYYVSNSQLAVYNFDLVKDCYYKNKNLPVGERISSCDALHINGENDAEFNLIEFRNMTFANLSKGRTRGEIKEKLSGSLLLLTDICGFGISKTRNSANFIVVYNGAKDRIGAEIIARATSKNNETNDFNLAKYENIYYKNCLIIEQKTFQNEFVDKWEQAV